VPRRGVRVAALAGGDRPRTPMSRARAPCVADADELRLVLRRPRGDGGPTRLGPGGAFHRARRSARAAAGGGLLRAPGGRPQQRSQAGQRRGRLPAGRPPPTPPPPASRPPPPP